MVKEAKEKSYYLDKSKLQVEMQGRSLQEKLQMSELQRQELKD